MGMTETEMIGVIVLACLVTAVIVRLLVGFAQRETDLRDCGDSGLYLDTGIAQTMGNKEIQSDRVRAERTQAGALAVIADGIGKRNIGEVCAQIAMDTILDRYEPYTFLSEPDHFFRMSFYEANRRVQMTLERSKGGTSLGAVFVNGTKLYYALAGNIRIALFRGGEIIPLSKGHTLDVLAEEAWKDGKISRQEAVWSMEEKRMWNYVGMDGFRKIEVESQPILTRPEDVVMLATSGIFEEVSWSEIEDILVEQWSLFEKAGKIAWAAEQKEGTQKENGSVILLRVPGNTGADHSCGGMA